MVGRDEDEEMDSFIEEFGLEGFEHIAPPTNDVWRSFSINAQPAYVFINDNGEVARQIGALEADVFETALERIIAN